MIDRTDDGERAIALLADDRFTPALLIVALAGLALGCLTSLAFVALFPFPVVGPPVSGVVGWVTVRGYPKSREAVYFGVIVLLLVTAVVACVAGWALSARFVARRRGLQMVQAAHRDVVAHLPLFAGFGLGVLKASGAAQVLIATVAAFAAAKVVVLLWPHRGSEAPHRESADTLEPVPPEYAQTKSARPFGAETVWPAATAAFAGCTFGWFLPMAVGTGHQTLASTWWLSPLLAMAAWLALRAFARRTADRTAGEVAARAALPLMPALAMAIMPFLIDFPRARRVVLAGVILAIAALVVAVVRRPLAWAGGQARVVRMCGIGGLLLSAAAWIWQPDFPGIYVFPGDGDHLLAFLNDGLHGKRVYRDFWYPYGPLFYLLELSSARLAGLDNYYTPAWFVTVALGTLALCLTARMVFVTWPFQLLGTLVLFLFWTPYTVQFRVYAGYFTAVAAGAAAASGRPWALRRAGVLAAVAFLFSHEAAIAAMVGAQLAFLWTARGPTIGVTLRAYVLVLRPFLGGLAAVLAVAALVGAATGTLVPYLRSTFGFVAVNDACCGIPFPNLRDELAMSGQSPYKRLRHLARFLIKGEVFRYFYLPVFVYLVVVFRAMVRALRGGPDRRQDVVHLALAGFGFVLYRLALGRSDVEHARFATVPALALGCVLLERAGLRTLGLLRGLERPKWPRFERLVEAAMLTAGMAFLGWGLRLHVLPGVLRDGARRLAHYHEIRHEPKPTGAIPIVLSARGGRFYFSDGVGPMVQGTLDYLRAQTGPAEGVYAFPYPFRYNVLLDRANPLEFGPCLWGAAARPSDQRRLIAELEARRVRYVVYDESEWPDMDGVPTGDRFAELADFLFTRYAPEQRIGATSVLRLRESGVPEPPSVLEVGRDEHRAFLHRGWYYARPEATPAGPSPTVPARWTSTLVTARLTPQTLAGELFVDALVHAPAVNAHRWLTASVNGTVLGRVDLSRLSGWTTLRFPMSASSRRDGAVLVRLDVDPYPAPWDMRTLGLIVSRVGFN